MTHEQKDGTDSRVLSTAGLDIAGQPTGRFGFQLRGKPESFVAYDFEAIQVDRDTATITRADPRPTLVLKLNEIERVVMEICSQHMYSPPG